MRLRGVSVRRLDRCTPSLTPFPQVCFHLCHTSVLIRSALTRFIVCLPAGKQAHSSFARTFTTLASSGCVCPQGRDAHPPILFCIILCGVFGSVPFGRASLALPWMSLLWLAVVCVLLGCFSSLVLQGSFFAVVR